MSRDKMINKRDTDSKRVAGQAWKNKQQVEFLRANSSGTAVSTIVEASGFDGNLTTSDTNLQLVAQKVDDLILGVSIGKVDFDFPTPTQVWTLNHSLETLTPGIELYDANGDRVDGAANVNVVNDAQVVVTFGSAIIGKATLIGGATTKTASDTSVDATLFDGNLAPTDTDLQKVAQKVDDLVVGGGEFQIYKNWFMIDIAIVGNWHSIAATSTIAFNEYNTDSGIPDTDTFITQPAVSIKTTKPLGFAIGNQTIVSLDIFNIGNNMGQFTKVSILKVAYSSINVYEYITELYRGDIVFDLINPMINRVTIPSSSFTATNINDGDIIYMVVGGTSGENILPCEVILKCSID